MTELSYVGREISGERAQPLFNVSKILEGEGNMNQKTPSTPVNSRRAQKPAGSCWDPVWAATGEDPEVADNCVTCDRRQKSRGKSLCALGEGGQTHREVLVRGWSS